MLADHRIHRSYHPQPLRRLQLESSSETLRVRPCRSAVRGLVPRHRTCSWQEAGVTSLQRMGRSSDLRARLVRFDEEDWRCCQSEGVVMKAFFSLLTIGLAVTFVTGMTFGGKVAVTVALITLLGAAFFGALTAHGQKRLNEASRLFDRMQ